MHVDVIKRHVPQRYPLLLVDRITSIDPGRRACALKNVTVNEPCYRNVADGAPLRAYAYPPSLLIESMAQTAGILLRTIWSQMENPDEHVIMFGAINDVEFIADIYPGDTLTHEVVAERVIGDTAILSGTTYRDGKPVCRAGQIFVITRGKEHV